ncbi:MAG: hypothetical protein AAF998_10475 [Bacteroidota bacterium]
MSEKAKMPGREHEKSSESNEMLKLNPGRSMKPPAFQLSSSKAGDPTAESNFLCGSIGKGGENQKSDLDKLATYLLNAGVNRDLISMLQHEPSRDKTIERYQREILGFRNPDGRIDPGGKTISAILALKGKSTVEGWYKSKPKEGKQQDLGGSPGDPIPPVISVSDYYSQVPGANAVPLSFLKKNMDPGKKDKYYRDNGCWHTCRYILIKSGFSPKGKGTADYMVEAASSGSKKTGNFKKWVGDVDSEATAGKSKLDTMLESGMPVIVGVNRNSAKHNARWTNTHREGGLSPTDHYVVIVGRVNLEGGKVGYRFFDPGRSRTSDACAESNLLIIENAYIKGDGYKSVYTMSEVRDTTND